MEFCILNVLRDWQSYGYEIVKKLQTLRELAITESTVYPVLTRLRKEGFVKAWSVSSPNGPARRYFSLTPSGRRRIKQMNHYWENLGETVRALVHRPAKKEKEHAAS